MKEFLERAWQDIKARKNLELYLVLLAIIIVFTADIVGVNTADALIEIVLAVLAVLLYGLIDARHSANTADAQLAKLNDSIDELAESGRDFFSTSWADNLDQEVEQASEVWLIGVSLGRTIKNYYNLIEQKLKQGHLIKVLLIHPDGPTLETVVSRGYARKDAKQKANDIYGSLNYLCDLQANEPGRLEIKTTKYPISYGAIVVNPHSTKSGKIYVERYAFRVVSDGTPKYLLRVSDVQWYDLYKEELNLLWDDGEIWKCNINPVNVSGTWRGTFCGNQQGVLVIDQDRDRLSANLTTDCRHLGNDDIIHETLEGRVEGTSIILKGAEVLSVGTSEPNYFLDNFQLTLSDDSNILKGTVVDPQGEFAAEFWREVNS